MNFHDISNEVRRTYQFKDVDVIIDNPVKINVSESGGHRVLDQAGVSHYIPSGWYHLYWEVKTDTECFSF
jgi:hypothetical protein